MNQSTYNALKSFIWGIANDCLVDVYDVGDYRKVILPMLVIRRFDAVLEPKHEEVVAAKKRFEKDGVTVDIDPALCGIAGQAFVNKSDFTLRDLRSRTNQQQLRKDFIDYLDGFSKNVQEIINKFHFRDQIPRLSEQDYNLLPVLNVYENIVYPIEIDGGKTDTRFVKEIIHTLGLEQKLKNMPNNLSGGQQQRVAIARALATKPAIILADVN